MACTPMISNLNIMIKIAANKPATIPSRHSWAEVLGLDKLFLSASSDVCVNSNKEIPIKYEYQKSNCSLSEA